MARQPIYDRRLKVFAYEILYRRGETESGAGPMDTQMSATALVRSLIEIGLDKLVGDKPAFVNIPQEFLGHPSLLLLPKDRCYLELLEDIEVTPETIAAINDMVDEGYRLALDDFVFGTRQEAFVKACKIVKVDVMQNDLSDVKEKVRQLKATRVRVLAEKVETMEVYNQCFAMGFDYFQGYFFAKPAIVSGRGIPQSRAVLIHLLTRIQDPLVGLDELEMLVATDVTLSFRLLRLVNSACSAMEERVESIRSSLIVLGLQKVVALVSLLAMSGIQDKPTELMVTAMVRAKMCESLAQSMGRQVPEKYFTAGLLSVLEAMFDLPMADLLEHLPLAPDLKQALLGSDPDNPVGQVLEAVLKFERGEWDALNAISSSAMAVSNSYLSAIAWADEATQALNV